MIVVDTNVMVHLVIGGQHGADSALLLEQDYQWAAPEIIMSELRNVLVGFVRRRTITPEQAKTLSGYAAEVLENRVLSVQGSLVIDVALECGLTAYDAEFVSLARTLNVPLATLDNGILSGAPDVAALPRDLIVQQ